MRELLLKNFVSKDKRRSELFLCEHYERNGTIQEIEKKTVYRLKDILEFTDIFDLELFLERRKEKITERQKFVIRYQSKRTGTEKLLYKVVGDQYIVLNDKVIIFHVAQYVKKIITYKNKALNIAT